MHAYNAASLPGKSLVLIIPLHRSLSVANFPFVTAALIVINCFVFFFLQGGDGRALHEAVTYYEDADLGRVEFPAFTEWLAGRDDGHRRAALAALAPPLVKLQMIESDREFLAALHADRIITPNRAEYADWHDKRAEFERLWSNRFTERWDLHFSEFDVRRLLGAMFLHGSVGHLVGNMIFLAILGMLVEGALGPALFLGLYLLSGFGAGLGSLAWRWGEQGSALGASGAIAGLMGAYCVLWGLRKVRVFYWFFVVFDYVRVPALAVLPFWLGWEILQLLFDHESHIGFDEHATGIAVGALLALAVRHAGWERRDFLAEDERADRREANARLLATALQHIGRLEVAPARQLLQRIDDEEPGQLPVMVALYRCARYGGKAAEMDAAARRVFEFDARREDDIGEIKSVFDDLTKTRGATPRLPHELALRLARLWLRIGADADAEALLRELAARMPRPPGVEAAWFALAQRAPEQSAQRRERLAFVVQQFPQGDFAKKAAFLLQQA